MAKMGEEMLQFRFEWKNSRITMMSQVIMVWIFQMSLCYLIWYGSLDTKYAEISVAQPDVAFSRFIAGIMMHVAMTTELKQGMAKKK